MKKVLFFIILMNFIYAENMISIKFMGLSIHPGGANSSDIMPLKLDKKGILVPNIGIIISYDHEIEEGVSLRFSQGIYYDCALQPAGFSQINLRGDIYKKDDIRINGGAGPTVIYRKSWEDLEGYNPTDFYKSRGNMEYVYLWYGGDFELGKIIDENREFRLSFVPGYPALMHLSAGVTAY